MFGKSCINGNCGSLTNPPGVSPDRIDHTDESKGTTARNDAGGRLDPSSEGQIDDCAKNLFTNNSTTNPTHQADTVRILRKGDLSGDLRRTNAGLDRERSNGSPTLGTLHREPTDLGNYGRRSDRISRRDAIAGARECDDQQVLARGSIDVQLGGRRWSYRKGSADFSPIQIATGETIAETATRGAHGRRSLSALDGMPAGDLSAFAGDPCAETLANGDRAVLVLRAADNRCSQESHLGECSVFGSSAVIQRAENEQAPRAATHGPGDRSPGINQTQFEKRVSRFQVERLFSGSGEALEGGLLRDLAERNPRLGRALGNSDQAFPRGDGDTLQRDRTGSRGLDRRPLDPRGYGDELRPADDQDPRGDRENASSGLFPRHQLDTLAARYGFARHFFELVLLYAGRARFFIGIGKAVL